MSGAAAELDWHFLGHDWRASVAGGLLTVAVVPQWRYPPGEPPEYSSFRLLVEGRAGRWDVLAVGYRDPDEAMHHAPLFLARWLRERAKGLEG